MKKTKTGQLFLMGKQHKKIQDTRMQLPFDVGGIKSVTDGRIDKWNAICPLNFFKVGGIINPKRNMST